ncbi:MAG: gluconokinase [Anaerolineales bacterium]|nr:gluconokinase [Anaerolineales bacterium]
MIKPWFVIVLGVSGSGKTTVGRMLAQKLGWDFYDADDFHPSANVAKMANSLPLNDADRAVWLATLSKLVSSTLKQGRSGVLACSALKEKYRQQLVGDHANVKFVYLKGSYALIRERMLERKNHYMKADLLNSQFEALEEPLNATVVDIQLPPDEIVELILREFSALSD